MAACGWSLPRPTRSAACAKSPATATGCASAGRGSRCPPGSTVEAGIGLEKTGNVIDLQPPVASDPVAGIAPEIGGVYGTPRSERNGIEIDGYGHISAPLATPELAGTIIEPVADAKGYVRTTQLDGTSQWVPPASTDMATHTELGTVRVPARNDHNQGLNLDSQGFLFAPPATPDHLGTILEPRDPRALHARVRDGTTGNAEWEMFEPGIGDVSDTVNVYGRTNSRWIQLQPGGTFPPASMLYVQVNGDTMQGPLYLHARGRAGDGGGHRLATGAPAGRSWHWSRSDRPAHRSKTRHQNSRSAASYEAPDDGVGLRPSIPPMGAGRSQRHAGHLRHRHR